MSTSSTTTLRERLMHSQMVEDNSKAQLGLIGSEFHTFTTHRDLEQHMEQIVIFRINTQGEREKYLIARQIVNFLYLKRKYD